MKRKLIARILEARRKRRKRNHDQVHIMIYFKQNPSVIKEFLDDNNEKLCYKCYALAHKEEGWEYLLKLIDLDPEIPKTCVDHAGRSLLMTVRNITDFRIFMTKVRVEKTIISKKCGTCLTHIIKKGIATYDDVRYLVQEGVDVNVTDEHNMTALMYSAKVYENPKFMQFLIGAGTDPYILDKRGNSLLMIVLNTANYLSNQSVKDKVSMLLNLSIDVNITNKAGQNALYLANKNCHKDVKESILIKLMEIMGSLKIRCKNKNIVFNFIRNCQNVENFTKIYNLTDHSCVDIKGNTVPMLIAQFCPDNVLLNTVIDNTDLTYVNNDGDNLLMMLARNCRNEVIMPTVIEKSDLKHTNKRGENIISLLANRVKTTDMFYKLIDLACMHYDEPTRDTIFTIIGKRCKNTTLIVKLIHLSTFNEENIAKLTLLSATAPKCCNFDLFKEIINNFNFTTISQANKNNKLIYPFVQSIYNIDINWNFNHLFTLNVYDVIENIRIVHEAQFKCIRYLLPYCDMNYRNPEDGNTILMTVIQDCFFSSVFISKRIKSSDHDLQQRLQEYYRKIIYKLVDTFINIIDINVVNKLGQNMLFLIAEYYKDDKCIKFMKKLIDLGADIDKTDVSGKNVLFYAMRNKTQKLKLIKYLLNLGASPIKKDDTGVNFIMQAAKTDFKLLNEFVDTFSEPVMLMEDNRNCTVLSFAVQHFLDRYCSRKANDASRKTFFLLILKIYRQFLSIKELNCRYNKHPLYLILKYLAHEDAKTLHYTKSFLEVFLFAPFADKSMYVPCKTYFKVHYYFYENLPPGYCKYNAIAAVTQFYIARHHNPIKLILKMIRSGYKVMDNEREVVSPLTVLLHGYVIHLMNAKPFNCKIITKLARVFINNGADVNQTLLSKKDQGEIPDALYLAAKSALPECVNLMLPYWPHPALSLLLFISCTKTATKLYPVLKKYGPLPYGYERMELVTKHLKPKHLRDFRALHENAPRTLKDYCRAEIRQSVDNPYDPACYNHLELPATLKNYLLYL